MNNRVQEIDAELRKLHAERAFLDKNQLQDLSWCAGCDAELEICWLTAPGLPKYKVHVTGANVPSVLGSQYIMGYSQFYYTSDVAAYDNFFYTDSLTQLVKFLSAVKFNKLEIDRYSRRVFDALCELSKENLINLKWHSSKEAQHV